MILDENSPIGLVPVWEEDEHGNWKETNKPLSIEKYTFDNIWNAVYSIIESKQDLLICFDGGEGSGKSQGATQIMAIIAAVVRTIMRHKRLAGAHKVQFTADEITYEAQELMDWAIDKPHWTPLLLDETKEIANRKRSMSKDIVKLEVFLSEMRLYHKIIGLCVPKIHDLTAYLSEHRIKMLFHFEKRKIKKSDHIRGGFRFAQQSGWYAFHGASNCRKLGLSISKGNKTWYPQPAWGLRKMPNYPAVDVGALNKKKASRVQRFHSNEGDIKSSVPSSILTKIKHEEMSRLIKLFESKFDTKGELYEFVGKGLDMHPQSISRIVNST